MKKLLILGASHSQLDLVEVAKEMGVYTVAVGMNDKDVAVNQVDKFIKGNILDEALIDDIVKQEGIDAIFTLGLEIALPVLTRVSLNNGLRTFLTEDSLKKFSNKFTWRQAIGNIDANLTAIAGSQPEDFEQFNEYPAVIKPVDGSGQRGVREVQSYEEVLSVFDDALSYSKSKTLILEAYAPGEEISINCFMYQGKRAFYILSDRLSYDEYPGGIVKAHIIPSKFDRPAVREKVEELMDSVSQVMGYENGHVYYQLKVSGDRPKLIEFTPRFDGCHMWRLIKSYCGLNLVKASLEWLLYGRSPEIESYNNQQFNQGVRTEFISDFPDTIIQQNNYKIPGETEYLNWYYKDGEKVKRVTGHLEKVGYYILKEESCNRNTKE